MSSIIRDVRSYSINSEIFYRKLVEYCAVNSGVTFDDEIHPMDQLSPQTYGDVPSCYKSAQWNAIIKKYPHKVAYGDPKEKAKQIFLKTEEKCRTINRKFQAIWEIERGLRKTSRVWSGQSKRHLETARDFIRYVLGDSPDINRILENCDFTPGTNFGLRGKAMDTTVLRKMVDANVWCVTPGAYHYFRAAVFKNAQLSDALCAIEGVYPFTFERVSEILSDKITVVNCNKIAFVPKTAAVHRTIAVEPFGNVFVQYGIMTVMNEKLKRVGIDLTRQDINQELAYQASISGKFATLDLSNASDSIATELVKFLLPPDWYDLLNNTRCKSYLLDGVEQPFSKFCNQGNAFCFPLETLIFTALAKATGSDVGNSTHIYGDDIIIESELSDAMVKLLRYCGFQTNLDKSFTSGPFRESCGADYYQGTNVRPVKLDFEVKHLTDLIKFFNLTYRTDITAAYFEEFRVSILEMLPIRWRFFKRNRSEVMTDAFYNPEHWAEGVGLSRDHNTQGFTALAWREDMTISRVKVGRWAFGQILFMAALRGHGSKRPFVQRGNAGYSHVRVNV